MNKLRVYEYLHIPLWLFKDTCWAMQFKLVGIIAMFPTVALAILIAYKYRKSELDFLPNLSILLWISANSIWMCDEFFTLGIKPLCYVFFFSGLISITYWLIFRFKLIFKN